MLLIPHQSVVIATLGAEFHNLRFTLSLRALYHELAVAPLLPSKVHDPDAAGIEIGIGQVLNEHLILHFQL